MPLLPPYLLAECAAYTAHRIVIDDGEHSSRGRAQHNARAWVAHGDPDGLIGLRNLL